MYKERFGPLYQSLTSPLVTGRIQRGTRRRGCRFATLILAPESCRPQGRFLSRKYVRHDSIIGAGVRREVRKSDQHLPGGYGYSIKGKYLRASPGVCCQCRIASTQPHASVNRLAFSSLMLSRQTRSRALQHTASSQVPTDTGTPRKWLPKLHGMTRRPRPKFTRH